MASGAEALGGASLRKLCLGSLSAPWSSSDQGPSQDSCLPLLLLKALLRSLLKSSSWLSQPGSISSSYIQRTWNDTRSLLVFPKARKQYLF